MANSQRILIRMAAITHYSLAITLAAILGCELHPTMKQFSLSLFILSIALSLTADSFAKSPKYIFYFISDGTGLNIVQAAEHYRADISGYSKTGLNGEVHTYANKPFLFTQFPVIGMATTYSASSRVTDSAASGTALATGHKTTNGFVGVLPDKTTPVYSIAKAAKELGMSVGVGTSVTVNHATPAAFFGHWYDRSSYHKIGHQLVDCDYVDFFGGAAIGKHKDAKCDCKSDLYDLAEKNGITICRGAAEYDKRAKKANKILLIQSPEFGEVINYAIDRKPGELTIEQVLEKELDFLIKKDKGKGFFLMNEIGGRVDWANHSDDAGGAFAELEAVNRCVEKAYEFYKKHPKETLIVITADHDTGGPNLGTGKYEMNLKALESQKISKDSYTDYLGELRKETNNNVSWEQIESSLKELWGFWTVHKLTQKQEKLLKDTYNETFGEGSKQILESSLYKSNEKLATVTCDILAEIAQISYAHGSHTADYVPVYAIGVGADEFKRMNDNAEIPQKIAKLMGIELK